MAATSTAVRLSPLEAVMKERGALTTMEKMSKAEFIQFAQRHEDLQLERESDGTVIILPLVQGRK